MTSQKLFKYQKKFDSPSKAWNFLNYLSRHAPMDQDLQINFISKTNNSLVEIETSQKDFWSNLLEVYNQNLQNMTLKLFADGGSRGNPGPGACGFIILDEEENEVTRGGEFFNHCTNNFAEYQGLKQGVKAALAKGITRLQIYLDSQLVVKQIKGEYKIKNLSLKPIYEETKKMLKKFEHYEIDFVPRKYNQAADEIANQIMDANL